MTHLSERYRFRRGQTLPALVVLHVLQFRGSVRDVIYIADKGWPYHRQRRMFNMTSETQELCSSCLLRDSPDQQTSECAIWSKCATAAKFALLLHLVCASGY